MLVLPVAATAICLPLACCCCGSSLFSLWVTGSVNAALHTGAAFFLRLAAVSTLPLGPAALLGASLTIPDFLINNLVRQTWNSIFGPSPFTTLTTAVTYAIAHVGFAFAAATLIGAPFTLPATLHVAGAAAATQLALLVLLEPQLNPPRVLVAS